MEKKTTTTMTKSREVEDIMMRSEKTKGKGGPNGNPVQQAAREPAQERRRNSQNQKKRTTITMTKTRSREVE